MIQEENICSARSIKKEMTQNKHTRKTSAQGGRVLLCKTIHKRQILEQTNNIKKQPWNNETIFVSYRHNKLQPAWANPLPCRSDLEYTHGVSKGNNEATGYKGSTERTHQMNAQEGQYGASAGSVLIHTVPGFDARRKYGICVDLAAQNDSLRTGISVVSGWPVQKSNPLGTKLRRSMQ